MDGRSAEERLERNELLVWPVCPFALPEGEDRAFLCAQQLRGSHKNISYDPLARRVAGHRRTTPAAEQRLRELLDAFSRTATAWLARELPHYAEAWQRDRASLRPEEEATRPLRHTARNDLLHIDAFPTRPSFGRRLLRLYVNLNPEESRVWATSETFPELLRRYAAGHRVPSRSRAEWLRGETGFRRLWKRDLAGGSPYDAFLRGLHHWLKGDDDFQERARKRVWEFPPNAAWLLFADGLSHAVLRGRFALEHSFFVPLPALALPEEAPLALLERAGTATRQAA